MNASDNIPLSRSHNTSCHKRKFIKNGLTVGEYLFCPPGDKIFSRPADKFSREVLFYSEIHNVLASAGYINFDFLRHFLTDIDGYNTDLKPFRVFGDDIS